MQLIFISLSAYAACTVDVLLHLSSETETTLRSLQNFYNHYNALAVGHMRDTNPWQLSFLSMNQLSDVSYKDVGIAKYNVSDVAETSMSNFHTQYVQQNFELKQNEDYTAVHRLVGYLDGDYVKLEGLNGNWAYLTPIVRYTDNKKFYFIQMTQTFGGYVRNKNSYKAISELLQYIIAKFPGLYIIVGDFNVQGHEKIFEKYLGNDAYHIAPFWKIATCNDNEGIASPDGLVVSKELYPRVEYSVDPYPGYSYQHFIVSAKLFQTPTCPVGMYSKLSPTYNSYLQQIIKKADGRDNFVGNDGVFNGNDNAMTGSINNIKQTTIKKSGGAITSIV